MFFLNLQFGGKLVSFNNKQEGDNKVTISQVASDESIMQRSSQLENSLASGNFADFCKKKMELTSNEYDRTIWSFLMVNIIIFKNIFLNHFYTLYIIDFGFESPTLMLQHHMN